MPDHFALLDEPRRPWLDADALKEKFHALTASQHPDVKVGGDFATINSAYQILSDPGKRLRHFLELVAPSALQSTPQVPPQLAELFLQVGAVWQLADAFLKKQAQAAAPLAQALLAPEKFRALEQLEKWSAVVEQRRAALCADLSGSDETSDPAALARILAELSFLSKWGAQLREMIFKFAL